LFGDHRLSQPLDRLNPPNARTNVSRSGVVKSHLEQCFIRDSERRCCIAQRNVVAFSLLGSTNLPSIVSFIATIDEDITRLELPAVILYVPINDSPNLHQIRCFWDKAYFTITEAN
jgi:hypothetical protein